MSYSIGLKVENGTVTVESTSGTVPDGMFGVSGHEDTASVNVGVMRRTPAGDQVIYASSTAGHVAFEVTK